MIMLSIFCCSLSWGPYAHAIQTSSDIPYAVEGGQIYFNPSTGLITGCDSDVTAAIIPEHLDGGTVTGIADQAFYNCLSLQRLSLPATLTGIGERAFRNCSSLTTLVIPDGVTTIGAQAFLNCKSLQRLILPEKLQTIEAELCSGCEQLQSISIPPHVVSIGDWAFYHCYALTSVDMQAAITSIGRSAFSNCQSLTALTLPGTVSSLGTSCFYGCDKLLRLQLSDALTSLPYSCFNGCTSLTCVAIPRAVTTVDDYAFENCSNLTTLCLPRNLTTVSFSSFSACEHLLRVYYEGDAALRSMMDIKGSNNRPLTDALWYDNGYDEGRSTMFTPVSNFEDVLAGAYFAPGVAWAREAGVTTGIDDTHFAPFDTVTRAQAVTFLYRAMGEPAVTQTSHNPFSDVSEQDYYYTPVLWAVSEGITNGVDDTHFAPDAQCSTAHLLTFLYRTQGEPDPGDTGTGAGYWYTPALTWAQAQNVLIVPRTGTEPCPRADVVTYLFRALQ